jgi:hypothetical protein
LTGGPLRGRCYAETRLVVDQTARPGSRCQRAGERMTTASALPIEEVLAPESAAGIVPPWCAIGRSREGRDVLACRLGRGDLHVSLIGGCHADEPVGPALLRRLAAYLTALPPDAPPLAAESWWIVPHVNPDGEVRNASWSETTLGHRRPGLLCPSHQPLRRPHHIVPMRAGHVLGHPSDGG